MRGSEAIVKSLRAEGVKEIFGILGGSIMDVYDVFDQMKEEYPKHILVRHEQVAAHAAEGYARASGDVGVCIATSGPGATNLVTGIADAYADSTPIVALTGQVPTSMIGNDAFQEADIIGITMPITKHNYQITDPNDITRIFRSAFKIAASRRQGPVLIDLPKDVQQGNVKKFSYPKDVETPGYNMNIPKSHPIQIKKAAEMLMEAERPIILAGGGIILSSAYSQLQKLAESLEIPVTTTLMGKGCFPEDHPLSLGMLGMHGTKPANLMVTECDVMLAIGTRFSDRITCNTKYFAPDAKIIHVDLDSAEIGKNVDIDLPIVGDAKATIAGILKVIDVKKRKGNTEWHSKLKRFKKEYSSCWDYDTTPIKQQRIMKELDSLIDKKTIITTEVGQCQMFAAHYLHITNPRHFISSGGLGTMGAGFPFAIGAKVAKPDHTVVDVGSEGSFLMTCQDLATCKENDINVVVLVMRNNYLGMVKQWQDLFYDKRRSFTYLGESPNFVKLAKAFGVNGMHIDKPSEVREGIKTAMRSGETYVLNIPVDPDEHILPMVPATGNLCKMIERDPKQK